MQVYDIQLFAQFDDSFREEINKSAQLVHIAKGESLFTGDELLHFFYIIVRGRLKVYQLNLQTAKEQTIFILKSGDMLDTITLLDGKTHDVMYEVLEDLEMLKFPIETVRHWLATNPKFNQVFFPYIASQMRNIEELATDLSLLNTSERLTKLILQNLDPNNHHKYQLIQKLSNSEIAKLIGTVRHVVERHLQELKKEGAIQSTRKSLVVKDIQKLLNKLQLL